MGPDPTDADRLAVLDRIADRIPKLDLDQHAIEWAEMPDDGSQALLIDGGGLDGGNGYTVAAHGEDLHVVGSLAPLIDGYVGCIVVRPDGSRYLAHALPDPLAQPEQPD